MSKNQENDKKDGGFSYLGSLAEYRKAAGADLSSLHTLKEQTNKTYAEVQEKLAKKMRDEAAKQAAEVKAKEPVPPPPVAPPPPPPAAPAPVPVSVPKEEPKTDFTTQKEFTPRQEFQPHREQREWTQRPQGQQSYAQQRPQGQGGGYAQQQRTGGFSPRPQGQQGYAQRPYQVGQSSGYGQPRPYQGGQSGYGQQQRPYQGQQGSYSQGGNYQRQPYTPGSTSGQRPYQPRPFNNTQGGQQGQRPYSPRPFGTGGFGQRPYSPRPAGSFGPRPAGNSLTPISSLVKKDNSRNKKDYSKPVSDEARTLNKRQKMKIFDVDGSVDFETEQRMGSRKLRFKKEKEEVKIVALENAVITKASLTVKELSEKISKSVSEILKKLIELGLMLTINSIIDVQTAELVANEFGIKIEVKIEKTAEEKVKEAHKVKKGENGAKKRPPVVTIMGHVDHGKTSLLDAIRKSKVASGEAGGITQHIGAYSIVKNGEKITFIDTPGHEAFSAMRARGAKVTDVAILVVAADDGIKPQTVEAIKHIKNAGVPMIVAVNKIDKNEANVERVKQQLTEHEVVPEEWGGDAIIVPVSARTGEGLEKLLENILLVSEVADLTAVSEKQASGTVLEAKLDKTRGVVATLLVQDGTLKIGDNIVAGTSVGKVKAMTNDSGLQIKSAGPSEPISVIGLDDVPRAGDYFYIVDAAQAKQLIEERKNKVKEDRIKSATLSAEDFLSQVESSKLKSNKLIIKTDVQGSAEALKSSLQALSNNEVKVSCITAVAGHVTENDVTLASTSGAIIIAFNIKIDTKIEGFAKQNKTSIKQFKIIYEAVEFIKKEVKKLKEPKYQEEIVGKAEVRNIFKLSSSGVVAGCMVVDGKIRRNANARLLRNGQIITTDSIDTLKIVKDDQREVSTGYECGIKFAKFNGYVLGDIIECFILNEIVE